MELDVHLSLDGQVVVVHDATLDRTTDGCGPVEALSLASIRALDAGSKHSPAFAGERVPTLQEVIDLVIGWPGTRRILIELKGPFSGLPRAIGFPLRAFRLLHPAPFYEKLASAVAALLGHYTAELEASRIVVQSFCRPYLDELRALAPSMKLLYLSASPGSRWLELEDMEGAALQRFDGLSIRHAAVTAQHVAGLRRHHGIVYVWTVDTEADIISAIGLGVDGIITNRPEVAVRLMTKTEVVLEEFTTKHLL